MEVLVDGIAPCYAIYRRVLSGSTQRKNFRYANLGPTGYTPFRRQDEKHLWCFALRSFNNEPPRSNLRAARLCKHRLALA